jgi:hypothetical protein
MKELLRLGISQPFQSSGLFCYVSCMNVLYCKTKKIKTGEVKITLCHVCVIYFTIHYFILTIRSCDIQI